MTHDLKSPLAVVRAFMPAMAAKDYAAGLAHVTDDCEYTNMPMGTVTGPQGIRGLLEPFFAPTLENEFIFLRTAEAGPVAFVERLDRHRLADRWVELPVTGVFEVRDGKIAVWRDYFDLNTIVSQWPELQALLG